MPAPGLGREVAGEQPPRVDAVATLGHVDVAHDQGRVGVGVEPSFLVVWLVRICAAPVNGVAVPLWVQSYVVARLPAL